MQNRAGLFRNTHEQVVEQFQHHRIGLIRRGNISSAGARRDAAQDQMIARGDFRFPAGFYHGGGIGFAQQGGTGDAIPGAERLTIMHWGCMGRAIGEEGDAIQSLRRFTGNARRQRGFAHFFARGSNFGDTGFDNHLAFWCREAKAAAMRLREFHQHFLVGAEGDGQEGIGARIAQMQPTRRLQPRGIGALARKLFAPCCFQRSKPFGKITDGICGKGRFHRGFADDCLVRQAHAIGGKHAGERMDEHGFHAQFISNQTGMLPARAAEAL